MSVMVHASEFFMSMCRLQHPEACDLSMCCGLFSKQGKDKVHPPIHLEKTYDRLSSICIQRKMNSCTLISI